MKTTSARRAHFALLCSTALCSLPASAQTPPAPAQPPHQPFKATCAKVVNINDGDTFRCVRSNGTAFPVRVASVDAPESKVQRSAEASREKLVELAVDGSRVVCSGNLSHQRWVCRVFTPQQEDVGTRLIEAGAVWYASAFAHEVPATYRLLYAKRQSEARADRIGLWADADPMRPWQCRKRMDVGKPCR